MSTINDGDQPYDDRHSAPPAEPAGPFQWVPPIAPAEGAMDRFAELPAQPTAEESRSAPWGDHVDTTDVVQAINYLRARVPNDTERFRPFNACLRTVLDELTKRIAEDVELSEPTMS